MKNSILTYIKNMFRWAYGPVLQALRQYYKNKEENILYSKFESLKSGPLRVFYLGVTVHPNLGDLAQRYCITEWIKENYKNYELIKVECDVIVNPNITQRFFDHFRSIYGRDDIIIFQSGYSTQDLGGNHPLMHRLVCDYMPDAHILMMPQTIFFKDENNRRIFAENHNKAKNMLFLARDFVSYEQAKHMFPDIHVEAFPDIVTTLIGNMRFSNNRNGICLCTRNDGEKLYSQEQINELAIRFESSSIRVFQKDTQAKRSVDELVNNLKHYIEAEIETYSHYQLTITDRYHGTIFSLCAGTPVIIIKTTDHKVITGADWFKGVYDEYVYVADDLNDAYRIAQMVLKKDLNHKLQPYFKTHYYDKLRQLFESVSFIS